MTRIWCKLALSKQTLMLTQETLYVQPVLECVVEHLLKQQQGLFFFEEVQQFF